MQNSIHSILLCLWSSLHLAFPHSLKCIVSNLIFQLLYLLNILTESYSKLSLFFLYLSIQSFSLNRSNVIHVAHDPSMGYSKMIERVSEYHSIP